MKGKIFSLVCIILSCTLILSSSACSPQGKDGEVDEQINLVESSFLTSLPLANELKADCPNKGTVETISYSTRSYALESLPENEGKELTLEKTADVYLPYGYTSTKKYNILYLLHGTGDAYTYWLEDNGETTLNVLDNLIYENKCYPTIVVCPQFYSIPEGYDGYYDGMNLFLEDENADLWPLYFYEELRSDLIPAVESKYSTYASGDTSLSSLISSREHRAFAGLSRGSSTVVNSGMMHCTDIFAYFGSFSGIWADFDQFKEAMTQDYASYPIKYWYNGTGTSDTVGDAKNNQIEFTTRALEELPDKFKDGENFTLIVLKYGSHAYTSWIIDLYNSMQVFFRN
jgi:enterochelin esterase-like enzyme